MKRNFSTLACMDATIPQLIRYAKDAGMDALEIRLDRQDRICGIPQTELSAALAMLRENGIGITDLGTSISLMDYEPEKIQKAKDTAALAALVGAKGLRLFAGGSVITIHDVSAHNLDGIVRSVKEINAYVQPLGVELWLETHSYFSTGERMKQILDGVNSPNVKVIWDVIHSVEFGESPAQTVACIGGSIAHVHLKDGRKSLDAERVVYELTALGAGTLPIQETMQCLREISFDGYLSLEWESAWHPKLNSLYTDIPDLLAAYNRYLDAV